MQCECDVKARFIRYCDLHQQEYERRITKLVGDIKADGVPETLWNPTSTLIERVYNRYNPVNCHASMVISDYVCFQNTQYQQKHLEFAIEQLLDRLFKEAKNFVQIEVQDNLIGKEITAELGVFKREVTYNQTTHLLDK